MCHKSEIAYEETLKSLKEGMSVKDVRKTLRKLEMRQEYEECQGILEAIEVTEEINLSM